MYVISLAKPILGYGCSSLFSLAGPYEGQGPINIWELAGSIPFSVLELMYLSIFQNSSTSESSF